MIRSTPLATHRLWVWGSIAGLVLLALYFSLPRQMPSPSALRKAVHTTDDEKCMAAAGNRTLGFESIQYLNLPHRTDRNDAMILQAYISGIDLQYFPGVYEDDISEVGLPPMSKKASAKMRVIACYRAHANIWSKMLQERLPAVLVMEADATWEVSIRPIMAELNHYFRKMLQQSSPAPLYGAASGNGVNTAFNPDPEDPWMTDHWDVLAIGHCLGGIYPGGGEIKYRSQYANEGPMTWKGVTLSGERYIHRAKHTICTAAYAVTQRGAAKLLLRSAYDLNGPIDLIINSMAEAGELVVYNVVQPPVMQWKYLPGIGMEQRNSDIQGVKNTTAAATPADETSGWPEARRNHSVWVTTGFDGTPPLKESALGNAWKHIFSGDKLDQW